VRRVSILAFSVLLFACGTPDAPMVPLAEVNTALAARSLPELDEAEYVCVLAASGLNALEMEELLRRDPVYRDVFDARQLASAHVGCIDHLKVLAAAPSQDAVRECAGMFPPSVAEETYLATLIADPQRLERALSKTASCIQDVSLRSTPEGPLVLYLRDRALAYVLDGDVLACATPLVPVIDGVLPSTDETAATVALALSQCMPNASLVSLMAVSAPADEACVASHLGSSTDIPRQVLAAYLREDETSGLALLESLRKACPVDSSTQPSTVPGEPSSPDKQ
jgi:hypothetical protein